MDRVRSFRGPTHRTPHALPPSSVVSVGSIADEYARSFQIPANWRRSNPRHNGFTAQLQRGCDREELLRQMGRRFRQSVSERSKALCAMQPPDFLAKADRNTLAGLVVDTALQGQNHPKAANEA